MDFKIHQNPYLLNLYRQRYTVIAFAFRRQGKFIYISHFIYSSVLMFLLAYSAELARYGAAELFNQNNTEIEKLNAEKILVTSKP